MSAFDLFAESPSTHHLLVGLLLTETGLFGVGPSHPENQHSWLVSSFSGIQSRLASTEWEEDGAIRLQPFLEIRVTRQEDARLFLKLYKGINSMADLGVTASKQVELVAWPLVREMVEAKPEMHSVLSAAYREHAARYGESVANRILSYLKDVFGLESIAEDRPAPQPATP